MMRRAAFLLLLPLAGCATPPAALQPAPAFCRIGPNDGPVLAERGIGGTGMLPFAAPLPGNTGGTQPGPPGGQNRGIGGTSIPAPRPTTGIVGEITGFASICVNGVEVGYNPAAGVAMDGGTAPTTELRAGQIVVITAGPPADNQDDLQADQISVRHEVTGPVSAVGTASFTIAGQIVAYTSDTRGTRDIQPGAWLAISGLRNASGVILATRIDPAAPGSVRLHGNVSIAQGRFWLGALRLDLPATTPLLQPGDAVTAIGSIEGDALSVTTITPDLLFSNPTAYFGAGTTQFLMESYVWSSNGNFALSGGAPLGMSQTLAPPDESRPAIMSLTPIAGGRLRLVGQSAGGPAGNAMPFLPPASFGRLGGQPGGQPGGGLPAHAMPSMHGPAMGYPMPGGMPACLGMMGHGPQH